MTDIGLIEGLWISLIGLGIVLVLLVILIRVFAGLSFCVQALRAKDAPQETPMLSSTHSQPVVAHGTCGQLTLTDVTDRDAAMIMAIVANKLDKPLNALRFVSIKAIGEAVNEV